MASGEQETSCTEMVEKETPAAILLLQRGLLTATDHLSKSCDNKRKTFLHSKHSRSTYAALPMMRRKFSARHWT